VNVPASERRVLFVCTHNAGRSIVADALNPTVVAALAERGISLAGVSPKPITPELLAGLQPPTG
jgi:protein-tyrosine-phosphatase